MMKPLHNLLLFAGLSCCSAAYGAPTRQPNVIFFLVDDMGWMDCGAYGSQYYETPNIDRLAARSMRFTNAYAQPLCSPSRCSLLTGQYSARHGLTTASGHQPPQGPGHNFLPDSAASSQPMLTPQSKNYMETSQQTLPEALHEAGYRTAHIGKWHLGLTQPHWPEQQGFDVTFHCHPDPGPPGNYFSPYGVVPDGKPGGKTRVGNITDGPVGEYIVDRLADEAIKFIAASEGKPFFLNLWNYGVHGPWGHKPAYTATFKDRKDPRALQGNPIMASMLKSVDECLGRILAELDKRGLSDNTIVIFNSDNGGNTHSNTGESPKDQRKKVKAGAQNSEASDWQKWAGNLPPTNNAPLRDGKGTLYEGGTRVPLMWAWPGHIKPGTTSDALVGHIDLYPTLLDLLNLPTPAQQKIDGISYRQVLMQTGELQRKAFFNYFPHGGGPGRAGGVTVRTGDWKLMRWFGLPDGDPGRYELYNLQDDLGETKNLAALMPDRIKLLDTKIDAFLADTGATYPRPNPTFSTTSAKPKRPAPTSTDPLENWKARNCEAVVSQGIITITGKANAFLGHGMGKMTGPATLSLRIRSSTGGEAKVEWLPLGTADPTVVKSVPYKVQAGDWQQISVNLDDTGSLGTMRVYLPASQQPLEVDWIEVRGKAAKSKPQRWEFEPAP